MRATSLHTKDITSQRRSLDWSGRLATAVVSMLGMLIVGGVMSMISIYARVATLTEAIQTMQTQVQRTLDHTVDRDEYVRRDAQIQRSMDNMATKDEFRGMQHQLDVETESLRVIEGAISSRHTAAKRGD